MQTSFTPNWWGGPSTTNEFGLSGTQFVKHVVCSVAPLHSGVTALDSATGTGYIMYSAERVFDRFSANKFGGCTEMAAV